MSESSDPKAKKAPAPKAAAFYDVDGTLISTNVVHAYAWYAVNVPTITGKIGRAAKLAASLPLYAAADRMGRKFFNDLFYKSYKGISEDRLYILGEELFEKMIRKNVFSDMLELMKRSRDEGYEQVIITGALDTVTKPLADYLGVDAWYANRLEFQHGMATGRLIPPVYAGPVKAEAVRTYAHEKGYALADCRAYADSASDIPMLSAVGHPVAVNPDMQLKATATAHNWPVMFAS
ncbi:MAG: HAD superfamily hydrolase (TIGR01490 family) [Bradymonadia bacterium]